MPAAGIVVSLAVGTALAFAAAPAAAGVIAGALFTPQVARAVQRKVAAAQLAFGHLQAWRSPHLRRLLLPCIARTAMLRARNFDRDSGA